MERSGGGRKKRGRSKRPALIAALDLGTNNCRLLIARPDGQGHLRMVDSFSRIVRLGEGVAQSGLLGEAAMERTVAALGICAAAHPQAARAPRCARWRPRRAGAPRTSVY